MVSQTNEVERTANKTLDELCSPFGEIISLVSPEPFNLQSSSASTSKLYADPSTFVSSPSLGLQSTHNNTSHLFPLMILY